MTAALVALALTAAGLAVTAALAWRSAASSKDALVASKGAQATLTVEAAQIQARLVNERDTALERAARLAAEVADRDAKIQGLERQLAELAAKYAKEKLARIAAQPPSQDGADAVNQLFEQSLKGGKP